MRGSTAMRARRSAGKAEGAPDAFGLCGIDVTTSSSYAGGVFEFSAGSPSNVERLATPQDFTHWLREAGLLDPDGAAASETDLADARALRDALYRSALALSNGDPPAADAVALINAVARGTPPRPQWVDGRIVHIAEHNVRAALAMLAGDAIATLADAQAARVRLCPECRMMFVDRSPAGKRRWCSSASGCGNRAKVREHRARRSQKGNTK